MKIWDYYKNLSGNTGNRFRSQCEKIGFGGKMFNPNLSTSRQKTPSSLSRISSQQKAGRLTSNITTPQRKPLTPLFGRNKSLNVSELPSGITELGPAHVLSDYGTPLPVAVTEALTQLRRDVRASAKLDSNGWVWLVCGRKLIIWNFKNVTYNKTGCCYELTLPSTDFPHDADLTVVFPSSDRQNVASCLSVSPEGAARYWYNIGLENSYTELSITLKGETCVLLRHLQASDSGFVVGTSSSILIHIDLIQGQLRYRVLKPSKGVLSGIGRRVSLFFTSSQQQQQTSSIAPLYQLLAGETVGPEFQCLYALTGGNLQKWTVSISQEKLLYESPVNELFRERLVNSIWKTYASDLQAANTWIMDVELVRDGVMVLGAGVNQSESNRVYYAIGILCTEGEYAPQGFSSFTVTGHQAAYENNNQSQLWSHLLVPNLLSSEVFICTRETIACVTVGNPEDTPDVVDLQNLGAGCSEGLPIIISSQGQLMRIQKTMSDYMASAVDVLSKTVSFAKLDTSIAATANPETITKMSLSSDRSSRLKAAFLASIRDASHQSDAQAIVDDLFPPGVTPVGYPDSLLDTLVVGLSQEMIDDYPASDPRWAESLPAGSASTSVSLILLHQLDDKLKAHELFLCFLKNYQLWDRLTLTLSSDRVMLTRMLLCEHAEKIEAAKALRNLHAEYVKVVDRAIEDVLKRRELVPFNNLTPQDLFYREVSRISDILPCVVEYEEERLSSESVSASIISLISASNTIIRDMIYAATQYRSAQSAMYDSDVPVYQKPESVPWTTSTNPRGVRSVIRRQFELTVENGLPETQSNLEKGILFQQLLDLADMLLDGYRIQLESLDARFQALKQPDDPHYLEVLRMYEQERTAVIAPFTTHHQYERATSLAEKYFDFATLVQLCDELDNPERLQMYMDKFKDRGFSDFVFQWHMNAGKRGKLLKADYKSNPSLGRFLQSKENKFMSWLHDIAANNYSQAHCTLLELGQEETEFLAQKKTLLSLSKLAALATVEKTDTIASNIELINNEHDLILHQEQLMSCQEVRESLAIDDADNMKVLTVPEMIELYVGDYNTNANEFDFKKALDLVAFIDKENPDWHNILLQVWSKAILRDRWNKAPFATDPIESCRDTVFYKTLDLIMAEDGDLGELLPKPDDLLASDLIGDLRHRSDFQCLLRAIYEHINRMAVDE